MKVIINSDVIVTLSQCLVWGLSGTKMVVRSRQATTSLCRQMEPCGGSSSVQRKSLMLAATRARLEATMWSSRSTLEVPPIFAQQAVVRERVSVFSLKVNIRFLFFFLILFSSTNASEPPVMIVEPRDDMVVETYTSDEVYLQCELSRSSGKVRWFKDGQLLEDGQNIQLLSEGPYRRLAIPSSRVEDSGEYVCETDGDSVFFQLTVKGKTGIEH